MVSFPHCKINLGLNVISRRADGYHNIETCFFPVPWNDILEIIPAKTISFTNTGISIPGRPEENLCLKAYYLLKDNFEIAPINMHLHKIVPMGAGLGGGSADGAFALRLLNSVFELGLSSSDLKTYASQLGSDCAFFIEDKPMLGEGRGEILSPFNLSLKGRFLIVVKPPIHVSTAEAYKGITPAKPKDSISTILMGDIRQWKDYLINDFEKGVFARHPEIRRIKDQMYGLGALYASMSGSGSSVFGIFDVPVDSKQEFQGCDYWSGTL